MARYPWRVAWFLALLVAVTVAAQQQPNSHGWWLIPYGQKDARLAWCGAGFGGRIPVILSDLDMVVVLTGWNILGGGITFRVVNDRMLAAVRQ